MIEAASRTQLLTLIDVARLGSQFPDAQKWRSLLELLGREGPKGQPLEVECSDVSGLPTPKALAKLHKLQFVAREFFKTHRAQPSADARAFSQALAAIELPPLSHTSVRLVSKGKVNRFVITHERLERCAVRFSIVADQRSGGHIALGRDQLARCSDPFLKVLLRACDDSALAAHRVLASASGLEVIEVLRGQLGPFVSGASIKIREAAPAPIIPSAVEGHLRVHARPSTSLGMIGLGGTLISANPGSEVEGPTPVDVRALRTVVKDTSSAVLSVQLERLGADVARTSLQDPWVGDEPPEKGKHLARERRLFCTPELEPALKALVAKTGKPVLVRSR